MVLKQGLVALFLLCSCIGSHLFATSNILNITLDASKGIDEADLRNAYFRSNPTFSGSVQDVYIGILVVNIDKISESSMDFRLHCYLYTKWINNRLKIKVVNQTYPIVIPYEITSRMWTPDIIFPNSEEIKTFVETVPNQGYEYFENGEIQREERFIFRVSCPMDFFMYPFDTQHCQFQVGLMVSADDKVLLHWNEDIGDKNNGIEYYYKVQPLQFRVSEPTPYSHTEVWLKENCTELRVNMTFYRRLTGSFLNYYMPSGLIVTLSWISFYIDVEAVPGRVTIGVTALLTIITQMINARNCLPPVQYITSMDIWLFFCLILVFASFIEYSIAYSYRQKSKTMIPDLRKPPNKGEKKITHKETSQAWATEREIICYSTSQKMDRISRWLFPTIMIIFCVSYYTILYYNTEIKYQ